MPMALPPMAGKKGTGCTVSQTSLILAAVPAQSGVKKPAPNKPSLPKVIETSQDDTSGGMKPAPKGLPLAPKASGKIVPASSPKLAPPLSSAPAGKKSAAKPRAVAISTARALYSYAAQREDELSFREGDVVTVIAKNTDGWWDGEANGARGVFPGNYVQELSARPKVKALWAYSAQRADELSFAEGDIIEVLEEKGNWHRGECGGRSGLFPANYVAPI